MKLTKKLQAEIGKVYNAYWEAYLKGDIKTMASCLDDNYKVIGSGEGEVFFNKKEAIKYFKATATEVAGKAEMRNRDIKMETIGELVLITEQMDMFALIENEWIFYSKGRLTTMLHENEGSWKIVQQHGSFPDSRADEGEQLAVEKISKENIELRDEVKRKAIELEQKSRELEIEAALERVRTRAMAMQKSDELSELVDIVFKELTKLDFALTWCIINIIDEGSMSNTVWAANPDITKAPESYHMLFEDYPFHHAMMKGWKERNTKSVYTLEGDEKRIYDEYLFSETEFKRTPEAAQAASRAMEKYVVSFSFSNFGGLQTVGDMPLSDANLDILSRFGKVFDLTYTRFNDLKQAEAQARESQIQLAMERVRARTMAMQRSDELTDTAALLFQQINEQGIHQWGNSFQLWEDDMKAVTAWTCTQGVEVQKFRIPATVDPAMINIVDAGRKGESLYVEEMGGEALENHYAFMFSLPVFAEFLKKPASAGITPPKFQVFHAAYFSYGYILFLTHEPHPETHDIFIRFAKVFEQTYTRFLDLQKSERQSREAQIELGLERVRARAMAMQKSDELAGLIDTVQKELTKLEFTLNNCIFWIMNDEPSSATWWVGPVEKTNLPESFKVPFSNQPYFNEVLKAWENRIPKWHYQLEGEEKKEIDEYLFTATDLARFPAEVKTAFREQDKVFISFSFYSYGGLHISTKDPLSEEQIEIVNRFSRVFDMTYTRFIDLQTAEAQARESQIQLAMERVRARTMAMQHSSELGETSALLFHQIQTLGVPPWSCGFNIWQQGDTVFTSYMDSPDGATLDGYKIPLTEEITFIHFQESRDRGDKLFIDVLEGERLEVHYRYFLSLPEIKRAFEKRAQAGQHLPTFQINHLANFSHGNLLFITYEPCPEAHDIFIRFAKVFEQTYTRFLDLQKSEAQAREAQIEAALEKVRSRSLAMHKSDELNEVVAILFEKLKELQFSVTAVGIGIYIDGSKDLNAYVCGENEEGLVISNYRLPYFPHKISEDFSNVRKKHLDFFVGHYSKEEKNSFYEYVFEHAAELRHLPDDIKNMILESPSYTISMVAVKNALFNINDFEGKDLSGNEVEIIKRFAKVFDQAYTRFLDLQKAEAQAREAKIEASLEKVRSKAMAMQKSEDLADAVEIVFEELGKLDIGTIRCGISIINKEDRTTNIWSTTKTENGTSLQVSGDESMDIHPLLQGAYAAWLKQENYSYLLKGEDLQQFYTALASSNFKLPDAPGEMQTLQQYMYVAHFPAGGLYVFSETALTEEAKNVTGRFADVFNLTYTRFNDLKQAEAQAREAKIETALERVRSRTMAMHKSEELAETAQVLFHQLMELGDIPARICIGILDEKNERVTFWATDQAGSQINLSFHARLNEPTSISKMYAAWKAGQKSLVIDLEGAEMADWIRFAREEIGIEVKEELLKTHRVHTVSFFSHGWILLTTHELQPAETVQLLERFSTVFNLTYRRFLDLQRSEANAREAQIEAGLERVRSRTMAMHSSDDVSMATATMFTELEKLGIENLRGGITNIRKDQTQEVWSVNNGEDGKVARGIGIFDMTIHPFWRHLYQGWDDKDEFRHYYLAGLEKEEYIKILNSSPNYLSHPIQQFPDMNIQCYYFGEGAVWAFSIQPHSEEDKQVMKRFASVFSLTFRRYQDLKKAEAQAREATIEAALEKVRGRAMAMHNSNDLSATASMVFTELRKLGINPIRCGVGLLTKESRRAQLYSATSSADGDSLSLVGWIILSKHPVAEKIYDTWLSNEDYYPELSGEELKSYYENLLAGLSLPSVPHWQSGQKQYGTFLPFSVGCLYAWSEIPYNETEIKILKRFGSIIDLTFRRYIELQKSESNAREAVKQAALDRVRADIASMRTISDLDRITPLIWNELNILAVPFIRCGVFIMDNSQQLIHTFLSTPDGKAIAAFHLPYDTPGNLSKVLSHWKDHQNYIDHWDESAFTDLADILVKQGAIASPEQYLNTIPHGGFYLHFLPFLQGMLYVGNTTQLNEDEIKLIQSVAGAFSTAYARYEDFNKLEAAKQQVDQTLVELKQTQTQLVQSEKMASLGELTAGIAHEIQNPLNFVNNFSEVSTELLDEMITELGKGNNDDAVAIADDVKRNLEKILQHGKRADGIVKGMLQHSRSSTSVKEPTDINKLADEYLRLAYHGLRAKDKSFNATLKTDYDESIGNIDLIPQDIGRAVLNLITNAFYVVGEKKKQQPDSYESIISVSTKAVRLPLGGLGAEIRVSDNGNGIPQKVLDKIFQPFFTTKPTGQGTGLGLSLAYDIVKAHGGELKVETKEGEGSKFIIQLPVA
ncbi:MAG: ATP-binding protein [Chitinophagaceae bacterium]